MKLFLKYSSLAIIGWFGTWALASPAAVRARTMAPESTIDTVNRWDREPSINYAANSPALPVDNSFNNRLALAANDWVNTNHQQAPPPADLYSSADIKSIIATNQSLANELQILRQQSRQQQSKPITVNAVRRDANKTDTLADVEFAEATMSRRASSIANEKGLALIPALRTIELRLLTSVDTEQGGKFKALVTTDVWDAGFANVGIPAGTLARGVIESDINDGDTRIDMTITEFVLPSGDLIQLRVADAVTDSHGANGPKGKVDHKWLTRLGSTVVCGFLGAVNSLGSNRNNNNNANNAPSSLSVAVRQNLAGEFGAQGLRSFDRGMKIKPTIELREGATIAMTLGSSLYLIPWERLRVTIPAPNQRLVQ